MTTIEEDVEHKIEEILEDEETSAHRIPVLRQLSIALGILILIFGTTYINDTVPTLGKRGQSEVQQANAPISVIEETDETIDPFKNIILSAKSVYVWDVYAQKSIYQTNADQQLPLASVTKLMTAIVAHELIGRDTNVPISLSAIQQDGESGFVDGEVFKSGDLLDLTLISSSNDGAYAIAEASGNSVDGGGVATFIKAMNIKAEDIGLSQTYFRNPTGLDISSSEAGSYGSARDIAFLMEQIITKYPEIVELTQVDTTSVMSEQGLTHRADNTNRTVRNIPGLLASKTGYTDLAGGNLVIAFNAGLNRPVIVSVLGSTQSGRFDDVHTLVDAIMSSPLE